MSTEEKITELEDIMDLDEGTLTIDSVLDEFEEWDSLSKLSLIAFVKKQMGKVLTVDDIKGFTTVGDICEYLG